MKEQLTMVSEQKVTVPVVPEIPHPATLPLTAEGMSSRSVKELAVLAGSVLFMAAGLAVIGYGARLEKREATSLSPRKQAPGVSTTEARPLVQHFDGSQPVRRGDLIVFETPFLLQAKPVLVAASETLVIRRGPAIESLYIMGPKSYLVSSEDDRKVVRMGKIRGTLAGSENPAP